jgi:hypothetical protein
MRVFHGADRDGYAFPLYLQSDGCYAWYGGKETRLLDADSVPEVALIQDRKLCLCSLGGEGRIAYLSLESCLREFPTVSAEDCPFFFEDTDRDGLRDLVPVSFEFGKTNAPLATKPVVYVFQCRSGPRGLEFDRMPRLSIPLTELPFSTCVFKFKDENGDGRSDIVFGFFSWPFHPGGRSWKSPEGGSSTKGRSASSSRTDARRSTSRSTASGIGTNGSFFHSEGMRA